MGTTRLDLQWIRSTSWTEYPTGVSLHSHTLHSRESLDFIYKAARHSALLQAVLRKGEARYRELNGCDLDLRRGWWTPPLAPLDAYRVESRQIRDFGMAPLVSLTDHDDIEAPMSLQAVNPSRDVPISVEWTVPFGPTFFHFGIHNLPSAQARGWMHRLARYTAVPSKQELRAIFAELHASEQVLVIFNHPLWDEKGIGQDIHRAAVQEIFGAVGEAIAGVEFNGLRPWKENRQVFALAKQWGKPVVSGGDRHALEANATLNLTNSRTFAEFTAEVRAGHSHVLLMNHYRGSHALRILHNMLDVFSTYQDHGRGWVNWADRVFYQNPEGRIASLTELWGQSPPWAVRVFAGTMQLASASPIRSALKAPAIRSFELVP